MRLFLRVLFVLGMGGAGFAQPLETPRLVVYRPGTAEQMRLFWNAVPGATSYDLFTCDAVGGNDAVLGSVTDTTYLDNTLVDRRYYRVRARNADTTSAPSNVAGYVSLILMTTGSKTAFGLPFKFWAVPAANAPRYEIESTKPSAIIGAQSDCGTISTADRVSQQGGSYAYRNAASSCGWAGTLETGGAMIPGKAYFYFSWSMVPGRRLVLAGDADTTGTAFVTTPIPAPAIAGGAYSVPYSWRDPRDVARNKLNLLAATFTGGAINTSDRVSEQGGAYFWYNDTSSDWAGTLTGVKPGKAYYIINKHAGHAWTYSYTASGQP